MSYAGWVHRLFIQRIIPFSPFYELIKRDFIFHESLVVIKNL